MKFLRNLPVQTRRDAWVEVDLAAIEHNASQIRKVLPADLGLMAIVKADAYGHGAVMVTPTLEASGVSILGVAAMDEAIQIRRAGLEIPILVIGAIPDWAVQVAVENDIQLTIFAPNHLESLKKIYALTRKPVKVHIKVDTGMHRIGINWKEALSFIKSCKDLPFLQIEGVFSHLASPEDEDFTALQVQRFDQVLQGIQTLSPFLSIPYIHLLNSAGALAPLKSSEALLNKSSERGQNLARLGISFFGYGPESKSIPLIPAMSLKGRIIHLQDLAPGEGVSYGQSYRNEGDKPIRLAVLPLGYADGVFRGLSNQIDALIHGKRVRQVGNITMDQMMFDVTSVANLEIGETMTLIGQNGDERITLSDWASVLNTIEYELMCALRVRLPKTYTRTDFH